MSSEKNFFDQQMTLLHSLSSIYQYLQGTANLMDTTYLLRAEYVLIISAFDNYLHSIVRHKLRTAFFSTQTLPKEFNLPIEICRLIRNESSESIQQDILDSALRQHLEKDSFQSPRSVEYALGLIGVNHIWKQASLVIGDTPDHIRNQLALIIKRRNQIAHEADIDYYTTTLRSIDLQTVIDCRSFLENLVSSIDSQIV